jgi:hypothetical protein
LGQDVENRDPELKSIYVRTDRHAFYLVASELAGSLTGKVNLPHQMQLQRGFTNSSRWLDDPSTKEWHRATVTYIVSTPAQLFADPHTREVMAQEILEEERELEDILPLMFHLRESIRRKRVLVAPIHRLPDELVEEFFMNFEDVDLKQACYKEHHYSLEHHNPTSRATTRHYPSFLLPKNYLKQAVPIATITTQRHRSATNGGTLHHSLDLTQRFILATTTTLLAA